MRLRSTPGVCTIAPRLARALRLRRRLLTTCAMLAVAFAGSPHPAAATDERLVIAGSGSCVAITRRLADAFGKIRPDVRVDVPGSIGSTGGIRAVADGAITVALASRPLREGEARLGLTLVPFARSAVVIAVHPGVRADAMTSTELVQIYRGARSEWRDGHPIVVITREDGDSGLEVLQRAVPGFRAAYAEAQQARRWETVFTDQEMHRLLASTPYGLGLADLGGIQTEGIAVKPLPLDGVAPTIENVRNGRYRLVKTLAFVFRRDRLRPEAKAFIEFVRSSEGARVLSTTGYVPAG